MDRLRTPTSEEADDHAPDLLPGRSSPTLPCETTTQTSSSSKAARNTNNEQSNDVTLLRLQVQLLQQLLDQRKPAQSMTPIQKLSEIYLPDFDPDECRLTVEERCKQVDSLINLRGFSMTTAMMKGLSCLRGRAKLWADTNAHKHATWTEIKDELHAQFKAESRYIHFVNKFRDYTSYDAKNYAEYVSEAWRLFSRISPNAPDDLMVEAVISGIRPKFIQAELLRSTPKSQAELIASLRNYRKRPAEFSSTNEPNAKQPRNEFTCNKCGKPGHRVRDCKSIYCEFCKRAGHLLKDCRSKPTTPMAANKGGSQANLVRRATPGSTEINID
ncbi:uncharacterized protein LOC135073159 [Ostrinia nubilalis]|uniref:uncharacterized protein LOC135073159 n=1 Tax=Ostrinia nubilalis TaxID=29057 RepID=UPI0030823FFB